MTTRNSIDTQGDYTFTSSRLACLEYGMDPWSHCYRDEIESVVWVLIFMTLSHLPTITVNISHQASLFRKLFHNLKWHFSGMEVNIGLGKEMFLSKNYRRLKFKDQPGLTFFFRKVGELFGPFYQKDGCEDVPPFIHLEDPTKMIELMDKALSDEAWWPTPTVHWDVQELLRRSQWLTRHCRSRGNPPPMVGPLKRQKVDYTGDSSICSVHKHGLTASHAAVARISNNDWHCPLL